MGDNQGVAQPRIQRFLRQFPRLDAPPGFIFFDGFSTLSPRLFFEKFEQVYYGTNDAEKCNALGFYLQGEALSFLRNLDDQVRGNWQALRNAVIGR